MNELAKTSSPPALPEPLQISNWCPADGTDYLNIPQLRDALEKHEGAMKPLDKKETAVLLKQVLSLWSAPDNWSEVAPFYRMCFEEIPADLARKALKKVAMECKFFPKPGDFTAAIKKDLQKRKQNYFRLRAILYYHDRGKRLKSETTHPQ